ncbi:MAG: NAD(P)/FAD-dependent oxidoreductase [Gammaproteobacteria bacterium]|nr:NAD(P)/FAD-dependent oxidoreductase [Gammaproteobacteria bacterium]
MNTKQQKPQPDVIIIGAGAAGLICAIEAGKRGRKVLLLEGSRKAGNKIRMSGGGRCNFTNYEVSADQYLSQNRHFVKSALSRYTQWDFLALVQQYQIPFRERDHGQLFCDDSAKDILDMLLKECQQNGVQIIFKQNITQIKYISENNYQIDTENESWQSNALVIATGGLSIPTAGASPLGYKIAEQFEICVLPPTAGLVPFTLQPDDKEIFAPLSGIAIDAVVSCNDQSFHENLLFTHRGLSGPVILQISNYWNSGDAITVDFLPSTDVVLQIKDVLKSHPKQQLKTYLTSLLPQRLVIALIPSELAEIPLNQLSDKQLQKVQYYLKHWSFKPAGTEGYRVAEVTKGGVDCNAVSSKTFEAKSKAGLYFIGEVLDVTGWLGGYNLQWAWSSGWCAGQYV